MKDLRVPLRDYLATELDAARERAAAPFLPEALREKLTAAARLGFSEYRISPLQPVDVRATAAAASGQKYLQKSGLSFGWEDGPMVWENVAGSRETHYVLRINLT